MLANKNTELLSFIVQTPVYFEPVLRGALGILAALITTEMKVNVQI